MRCRKNTDDAAKPASQTGVSPTRSQANRRSLTHNFLQIPLALSQPIGYIESDFRKSRVFSRRDKNKGGSSLTHACSIAQI
jgi:hypothetical protein